MLPEERTLSRSLDAGTTDMGWLGLSRTRPEGLSALVLGTTSGVPGCLELLLLAGSVFAIRFSALLDWFRLREGALDLVCRE